MIWLLSVLVEQRQKLEKEERVQEINLYSLPPIFVIRSEAGAEH